MAKLLCRSQGEVHPPGCIGGPTEEFTIDKITDPAEGISQRNYRTEEIGKTPHAYSLPMAKDKGDDKDTDGTTMIRHTGKPHKSKTAGKIKGENDLEGTSQVIVKIVEQHISESGANEQSGYGPDKIVLYCFR